MNPCLRQASLSDIPNVSSRTFMDEWTNYPREIRDKGLRDLYDAEWRKRGFLRSP